MIIWSTPIAMSTRIILFLMLGSMLVSYVAAAAVRIVPPSSSPQSTVSLVRRDASTDTNEVCGFDGNSDLYGLGIRLGVYFQWVSTLVVYFFYPGGRRELYEAYSIFIFAIMVAIILVTAEANVTSPPSEGINATSRDSSEASRPVEIVILSYIIWGGILTTMAVATRRRYAGKLQELGNLPIVFSALIITAACIYYSWFWLRLMHTRETILASDPCAAKTFVFIFAKVGLYNLSLMKFFAVLSIFMAIFYVSAVILTVVFRGAHRASNFLDSPMDPWLRKATANSGANQKATVSVKVGSPVGMITATFKSMKTATTSAQPFRRFYEELLKVAVSVEEDVNRPRADTLPGQIVSPFRYKDSVEYFFVNIFVLVYSVLGVELTIYWNQIDGVYTIRSVGQLIPFVIGVVGFLKISYSALKERYPWFEKFFNPNDKNTNPSTSSLTYGDKRSNINISNDKRAVIHDKKFDYLDLARSFDSTHAYGHTSGRDKEKIG